jgi:hypothetical protein
VISGALLTRRIRSIQPRRPPSIAKVLETTIALSPEDESDGVVNGPLVGHIGQ